MSENVTDEVINRVRMVKMDAVVCVCKWHWVKYRGVTIEQAAIEYATEAMDDKRNCSCIVVEVERDGTHHLIRVDKVVTYRTSGLRGHIDAEE